MRTIAPVELTHAECVALLASQGVGRIAYTDGALPQVLPVNYAMDGTSVVIRTRADGVVARNCRNSVVAFEVDSIDPESRRGRSVMVVGTASAVSEESELVRLRQLPFAPWAGEDREQFLRITPGFVTGRAVG